MISLKIRVRCITVGTMIMEIQFLSLLLLYIYLKDIQPPPNIPRRVIFKETRSFAFLYKFRYVGVGIFSLYFRSFLKNNSWYIFIVLTLCRILQCVHIIRTIFTILQFVLLCLFFFLM